jgi:hypothetical protein
MLARMGSFLVVLGLVLFVVATPRLNAQIHGVPASVTSFGFGGSHSFTPGVAASVTSLGPRGFGGGHGRFGNCCFNPFSETGAQSPIFMRGRHSHRNNFFGGGLPVFGYGGYGVPYPQVVVVQPDTGDNEDDEDYYDGGPTIFDRRGSRARRTRVVEVEREPAPTVQPAAEPAAPIVPQPNTVIIFRDGHHAELQNYAIVGDTLFDLTDNRSHRIQLADIDLPATRKANDERGVDFQIPGSPGQ